MSFCLFLLVYLQFLTITLSKITLPGVKKDIFETNRLFTAEVCALNQNSDLFCTEPIPVM